MQVVFDTKPLAAAKRRQAWRDQSAKSTYKSIARPSKTASMPDLFARPGSAI